jgi:hypothetical protein
MWGAAVMLLCGAGVTRGADVPIDFQQGTEFYTLRAGYQNARGGENTYVATVTGGIGKYFLDNAAYEIQLAGYWTHDDEDAVGLGINALARYHFVNWDRYSIYGDVFGGIFGTTDDFPTGGTCINGTYGGGPGLSIRLRDGLELNGGIRFQHISNGYIQGRDKNPIFNSFGGYVGLQWTR